MNRRGSCCIRSGMQLVRGVVAGLGTDWGAGALGHNLGKRSKAKRRWKDKFRTQHRSAM